MIPPRLIMLLVAGALLAALMVFGPSMCSSMLAQKEARKIEGGQAEATLDALDEADATETARQARARAIETEAKELADEIREAPAGNSNAAADAAVCKLRQYRSHERCAALRAADPGNAVGSNAPG